jgi:cell division transport system permease protein
MKMHSGKKVGSYPAAGVTLSISLALYVMGIFGILYTYAGALEKIVRENVKVQVYLNTTVNEAQRQQIENKLQNLPFADKTINPSIQFVSKEEAAKKFIAETGEDFQAFLGDNPLKDAFLLRINPAYQTAEKMTLVKKEIEKISGVFQVFYVEGLIDDINQNVNKIALFLLFVIAILLATIVILINNTMRIALFSQRFLIRSMQLVGAKQSFIQWPFIKRAAGYGLLAGLVATIGLYGSIVYAQNQINDLRILFNTENFLLVTACLFTIGIFISMVSSYFAVKKYLKLSLDELF